MTTIGLIAVAAGLAGAAVVWLRRRWLVVTVRGNSMLPTYQPGDVVLARRCRPADVRVGDVVIFLWPRQELPADSGHRLETAGREWLLKRVVAVAGDPVPAGMPPGMPPGGTVAADTLVVFGDNAGFDSRVFGALDARRLLAVVVRAVGTRREPEPDPVDYAA